MGICYVFDNNPYPYGESTKSLTFIESLIQQRNRKSPNFDDVLFLNTEYDLEFVSSWKGKEVITNRGRLVQVLSDIQQAEYRHVFLDIRLENNYKTASDSALCKEIRGMGDALTFAKQWDVKNNRDVPLIDSNLVSQAAYCDFTYSGVNSSFQRYQFIQHYGLSAPLKIYQRYDGHTINPHNIWFWKNAYYTDNGRLCLNSLFITIPEDFSDTRYRMSGIPKYYNLTQDFYGDNAGLTPRDFQIMCDGKLLVIGNFKEDVHDTYLNKQPGPYLNYLAFDSLRSGKHIIPFWYLVVVLLVFSITLFQITEQTKFIEYLPFVAKSKFLRFLLTLVGYTALLSVLSIITYSIFGRVVAVFIPTLYFSIVDLFYRYKRYD